MILSTLFGALVGSFLAMLATPLLWKLEAPTGMELAGHSGPSDGVLSGFALCGALIGFCAAKRITTKG
jgi:hypothetical protein